MPALRVVIVIDYQNVHLVGAGLFEPNLASHECLVHPLYFAEQLIRVRNLRQGEGHATAELASVLVYRGLPSALHDPKPYARNLAQKNEWERDPKVVVTLRPLKYRYQRTSDGRKATDANGVAIITGKEEKGVDVLCALAMVREARDPGVDLVVLASQDSDLEPALDEAILLGAAKIETASWFDSQNPRASHEIRPSSRRIWNTRLGAEVFRAAQDRREYS